MHFPKLTSVLVICGLLSALYAPSADAVNTYRGRGTYVTLLRSNIKFPIPPKEFAEATGVLSVGGVNQG